MWKWLVSLLKGWGRGGKPKVRRLTWPLAGLLVDVEVGDCVPRVLRIQFPPTVRHLTWALDGVSVGASVGDVTFNKGGGVQLPPSWRSPMPPISVPQGGSFGLAQLIDNKGAFAPKYTLNSSALPANVTLDQQSGVISASTGAIIGAQTVGVSFKASDAGPIDYAVTTYALVWPLTVLGFSKHLAWGYVGGDWYQYGGDHPRLFSDAQEPTPWDQDGRQEIIKANFVTNTSEVHQHYFLRAGDSIGNPANNILQGALPDDPGGCVRGNELWVVANERVSQETTTERTASVRASFGADIVTQNMQDICAYNPLTKVWRIAYSPRSDEIKGDRAWGAYWDSQRDWVITPTADSFLVLDAANQLDISGRSGAGNNLNSYGAYDFHASGMVSDGRTAYVYDHAWAHGKLMSFDLDWYDKDSRRWFTNPANSQLTLAAQIGYNQGDGGWILCHPKYSTWSGAGRGTQLVWHPVLRAVLIYSIYGDLAVFRVDAPTSITYLPRRDGFTNHLGEYVAPAFVFYDPGTGDVISIGSMDWTGGEASAVYWRSHFFVT